MKTLYLMFLSFFLTLGCANQKNNNIKEATIEYSAVSRGFYQKILIENNWIYISNSRNEKAIKTQISDNDWKKISIEFNKINLDEIALLEAPTEKRFYDGAAIAHLKIKKEGKTYETKAFDHGFPPKTIEVFINSIVSLNKENKIQNNDN